MHYNTIQPGSHPPHFHEKCTRENREKRSYACWAVYGESWFDAISINQLDGNGIGSAAYIVFPILAGAHYAHSSTDTLLSTFSIWVIKHMVNTANGRVCLASMIVSSSQRAKPPHSSPNPCLCVCARALRLERIEHHAEIVNQMAEKKQFEAAENIAFATVMLRILHSCVCICDQSECV